MVLAVAVEPSPVMRAIRAAADVVEVDEGGGFCSSVYLAPNGVAVARLDRSIRGAPHEGAVLRWTMEHTTGLFGHGLFVYGLSPTGAVAR